VITNDENHKIKNKELRTIYDEEFGAVGDSFKKFKTELGGLGAKDYRKNSERGMQGLIYNPPVEPIE
jgi:hypothetical protein